MFLQKNFFFSKIDKNWNENNKQTSRRYGDSESSQGSSTLATSEKKNKQRAINRLSLGREN